MVSPGASPHFFRRGHISQNKHDCSEGRSSFAISSNSELLIRCSVLLRVPVE